MGKKKGAIAAKARAKRQMSTASETPCVVDEAPTQIVLEDGCCVHRGLQNLGNTCYMNSVVQCLNVSRLFADGLVGNFPPTPGGITSVLAATFRGIRAVDKGNVSATVHNPKPLHQQLVSRFPWFRGKEQQDAHEFLRTLLGSVSDEFEEVSKSSNSTRTTTDVQPVSEDGVSAHFGGRICTATLCWKCSRISFKMDPFLDLPLHLPSLAGQQVGAMGVTYAMSSGERETVDVFQPEESCNEQETNVKNKRKKHVAPKKAPLGSLGLASRSDVTGQKPLMGVWGAAKEREELIENTRIYVRSLLIRLLRPPEDEVLNEILPITFEIELERNAKAERPWGFRWSDLKCSEDILVVQSIVEDSVVEKWNLKRHALGDLDQAVCVGDRLLEVNGETDYKDVNKILRTADKVALRFSRPLGSGNTIDELGRGRAESDGKEECANAAREERRINFCNEAAKCYEQLPSQIHKLFAAEEKNTLPTGARIPLNRCLKHFSSVQALEDDFKPTYSCRHCQKKDDKIKTFASQRMWICSGGLPPLLTLQLKRFRRYLDRYEKSSACISLPQVLELEENVLASETIESLAPFVEKGLEDIQRFVSQLQGKTDCCRPNPLRYELYALCVHQGTSMRSGHYVAYVNSGQSLEKEKWFGVSDTRVWKCDRDEVLKAEAYVVFYRREGSGDDNYDD